jgi:hypothetical protein
MTPPLLGLSIACVPIGVGTLRRLTTRRPTAPPVKRCWRSEPRPHPSSRQRKCMERTDERIKSLVARMVARQPPLMRTKVRAYSHQGHGPRADQTGRIHISDFRFSSSLAKRSRSIHSCHYHSRLRRRPSIRSHAARTSAFSIRILIDWRGPLLAVVASGCARADPACLTGRPGNRPSLTG